MVVCTNNFLPPCRYPATVHFQLCNSLPSSFSKPQRQLVNQALSGPSIIMSAPALQARLNYLTDAAHLLAAAVPDASAFLMTRRQALTSRHDIPVPNVEKQHVCAACGNIMVLGCNSSLTIASDRALRSRRQRPRLSTASKHRRDGDEKKASGITERTGAAKTVTCDRCRRSTTVQLPPPPKIARARKAKNDVTKRGATEVAEAPKPSANAVSKKRAKNRKAGLQALLAESKASASKSGSGLTLANFMKK